MRRDDVPLFVSKLLDGRPVRWTPRGRIFGDYEGRERTLDVFNADAHEQRALLRALRPHREELARASGGPLVIIFHTEKESARLYGDFIRDFDAPRPIHAEVPSLPCVDRLVEEGEVGAHRKVA